MCDQTTERIADCLHEPFAVIGKDLSNEYGGAMKHLWIDFELIESHAARRPPWAFRFRKRVGGPSADRLTGLPTPVYENVGHYSVRPDFAELRKVPLAAIPRYALSLVYASTAVLVENQGKLGGFDAEKFRSDFVTACRQAGHPIDKGDDRR